MRGRDHDEFAPTFESAFARFQVRLEVPRSAVEAWPAQIAALTSAALEFAAEEPDLARVLTVEALGRGSDGIGRYNRLVGYLAEQFSGGRDERPENANLPETTEWAVAGGLVTLIARRLDEGRAAELPAAAADAIQFVLTPYLGVEEARRIAEASG